MLWATEVTILFIKKVNKDVAQEGHIPHNLCAPSTWKCRWDGAKRRALRTNGREREVIVLHERETSPGLQHGANPGRCRQGISVFLPRTARKSSIMESEYWKVETTSIVGTSLQNLLAADEMKRSVSRIFRSLCLVNLVLLVCSYFQATDHKFKLWFAREIGLVF